MSQPNGSTNGTAAPTIQSPATPKPAPTALVKRDQGFEPETMNEAIALSERFALSALLPDALKGKPNDVLITMLQGRELGLSPVRSLNDIYVVKGKPMCSADTMKALCLRHPDICEYFYTVEATQTSVTLATKRAGSPKEERQTFTLEMATKATLTTNALYERLGPVMLEHRCTAILCRRVYPDLIRGFYIDEEADEVGRSDVRGGAGNFTAPPEPKSVEGTRTDTPEPKIKPFKPPKNSPAAMAAAAAPVVADSSAAPSVPPQNEPPAPPVEEPKPGALTSDEKRLAEMKELIESVQTMEGFVAIGERSSELMEGASDETKSQVKALWAARREALKAGA